MPPGKKHKKLILTKPISSYVHPALEIRSSHQSGEATASKVISDSVNGRIEHLRRTQGSQAVVPAPKIEDLWLESIKSALPPTRRCAGPACPRSWVAGSGRQGKVVGLKDGSGRRAKSLDVFPSVRSPAELSLLHQTLKAVAIDFEWHVEFDHTYLSTIPIHIKTLLLSYVVKYGPDDGIGLSGLHALFATEQTGGLYDATDNGALERLDLSGSVGRALSLQGLNGYWLKNKSTYAASDTPDTWDSISASLTSRLRFPTLTHLSLAYPGPTVSWTELLTFSRHLGALTHLSLSHWPTPRLPTAAAPMTSTNTTTNNVSIENNCADAAHVLRQLSRNTPSLTWLSLDGCQHWWRALRHTAPTARPTPRHTRRYDEQFTSHPTPATITPCDETGIAGSATGSSSQAPTPPSKLPPPPRKPDLPTSDSTIDWTTTWRHITHLSLTQSPLPPSKINLAFLSTLHKSRGHSSLPHSIRLNGMILWRSREEAEAYRIVAPAGSAAGESVRESMEARERRREWCEGEVEAVQVESFVRGLRLRGGRPCVFEHGWGREELVEVGYDEGELFAAGF